MARVLVTGASGFLGRFIPGMLSARGHEVHLAGRNIDSAEWPIPLSLRCARHSVDLCADGTARTLLAEVRPTHLLHMAWYAEPGLFWNSAKNLDWVSASAQLFRAFVEEGGQRFVGVGTCAEYDWSHHTLSPDRTPLNPSTSYGSAKARLYQLLSRASHDAGISFAWGRVFFPFGPWEHPARLLPQIIQGILHGNEVDLSEGTQVRDFIYSEDAARIFVDLLDKPFEGPINVASGSGMSIRAFAETVARHLGHAELLRFGRKPAGNDYSPYMVADVSNLRREVDTSCPIGIEEGLARTIAWWRLQNGA